VPTAAAAAGAGDEDSCSQVGVLMSAMMGVEGERARLVVTVSRKAESREAESPQNWHS
jgi:hypothetical protein